MSAWLPLFPLTTVLVPGLVMPLHIFEPRYRGLVSQLLAEPDEAAREFGIVAVREGRDVNRDGLAALYPVGTSVLLREAEELDDGRFDIVTTGHRRFRLLDLDASAPLAQAQVEFLPDIEGPEDDALALQVAERFLAYRQVLGGQVEAEVDDEADLPDEPTVLSYLVTAAMLLPTAERQELLAAESTTDRLRQARMLLARETTLLSTLGAVPALDSLAAEPSAN